MDHATTAMLTPPAALPDRFVMPTWMARTLLGVVTFLPAIVFTALSSPSFASIASSAQFLGALTGVLGFSLMVVTTMLATRFPVLERIFGTIVTSYRLHQTYGGWTLVVLTMHPLLLAIPYLAVSNTDAAMFLLPIGDIWKILGVIGLVILEICLIFTYYVKLPYERWKKIHRQLAFAVVLGGLHGVMIGGALKAMPMAWSLVLAWFVAGVVAVTYRVFAHTLLVPQANYIVKSVDHLGPKGEFTKIVMSPENRMVKVAPGQFAYFTFQHPALNETHPFSVCPQHNGDMIVIAKAVGDFTERLKGAQEGMHVKIEGAFGNFSYKLGGNRQIWIAGGIGITPFLSMATHLPHIFNVDLVYVVNDDAEAVALDELRTIEQNLPAFRVHLWNAKEKSYLTADAVKSLFPDALTADIFVCGPPAMMDAMRTQFTKLGIPDTMIHDERFTLRV